MSTPAPTPPPPEEGYTKFPNPFLEGIIRAGFNGAQTAVVLSVIRRTYGWHQRDPRLTVDGASIPYSAFIADTGLGEQTIRDAIKVLRAEGVLVVKKEATFNSAAVYLLRKDSRLWGKFKCETDALRAADAQRAALRARTAEGPPDDPPPPPNPGGGTETRTSRGTGSRTSRGTEARTSRGTGARGSGPAQRHGGQRDTRGERKGKTQKHTKDSLSVAKATGAEAPEAGQLGGEGDRPMRYRDYMNEAAAIVRDALWINGEPPQGEGYEGWEMKNELSIWRQLAERFGAAAVNRGLRCARAVLGIPADQPVTLALFYVNGRMDRMQRCIGALDRQARRESMRDTSRVLESLGSVLETAAARAAEGSADAAA